MINYRIDSVKICKAHDTDLRRHLTMKRALCLLGLNDPNEGPCCRDKLRAQLSTKSCTLTKARVRFRDKAANSTLREKRTLKVSISMPLALEKLAHPLRIPSTEGRA